MAGREGRFDDHVGRLGETLGRADRRGPPRAYTTGLLPPGERESVEPTAVRVAPARVGAAHQAPHHVVAEAPRDDDALLRAVRACALPALRERGPVRARLVDDAGLPRKGRLPAGVARRYCGRLGKQGDCQVAVTPSVVTGHACLPVACRLRPPEAWAADPARRALAGVPEEVAFATGPAPALDRIGRALADGVPPGEAVTDAGHGDDTDFREGITARGLADVAGILGTTGPRPPPGAAAARARAPAARGRGGDARPSRPRRGGASPGARARRARRPRGSPPSGPARRTATSA